MTLGYNIVYIYSRIQNQKIEIMKKLTDLHYIMIYKKGKRYYLNNAPFFLNLTELHKYTKSRRIKNYEIKTIQKMVEFFNENYVICDV